MEKKLVSESKVEMTELVLPNDTNLLGNLLGGRLMHWIDIAGAMAASRHANRIVATAVIDSIDFRNPVSMGELVVLKANLTWTGNTSMEVVVEVLAENIKEGRTRFINKSFLVFVALDDNGKPVKIPKLELKSKEEDEECQAAIKRNEERLEKRKNNI